MAPDALDSVFGMNPCTWPGASIARVTAGCSVDLRKRIRFSVLVSTDIPLIVAITTLGVASGVILPENAVALDRGRRDVRSGLPVADRTAGTDHHVRVTTKALGVGSAGTTTRGAPALETNSSGGPDGHVRHSADRAVVNGRGQHYGPLLDGCAGDGREIIAGRRSITALPAACVLGPGIDQDERLIDAAHA